MIRSFRRVACHGLVVFFFRPSQLGQCRFQRISSHSLSLSLSVFWAPGRAIAVADPLRAPKLMARFSMQHDRGVVFLICGDRTLD